jgi:heme-degrading monooxygenase HmoA
MIVQFVKFESGLTEAEAFSKAEERSARFREIPGLVQKYYVKLYQPNRYGGIYIWDSAQSMQAFRESELAASIPAAYAVAGAPTVEIYEGFLQLRD